MKINQNGIDFYYYATTKQGVYIFFDSDSNLYYRSPNGDFLEISYVDFDYKIHNVTSNEAMNKGFYLCGEEIKPNELTTTSNPDFESQDHRLLPNCGNTITETVNRDGSVSNFDIMEKVGTFKGQSMSWTSRYNEIYVDKNGYLYVKLENGFTQLSCVDNNGKVVPLTINNYETAKDIHTYQMSGGNLKKNNATNVIVNNISPIYLDEDNIVYKSKKSYDQNKWASFIFYDEQSKEYYIYDKNQKIVLTPTIGKNGELLALTRDRSKEGLANETLLLSNYDRYSVDGKIKAIENGINETTPTTPIDTSIQEAEYDFAYDSEKLKDTITLIENKKNAIEGLIKDIYGTGGIIESMPANKHWDGEVYQQFHENCKQYQRVFEDYLFLLDTLIKSLKGFRENGLNLHEDILLKALYDSGL